MAARPVALVAQPDPEWDEVPTTGAPELPEENPRRAALLFLLLIVAVGLTCVLLVTLME